MICADESRFVWALHSASSHSAFLPAPSPQLWVHGSDIKCIVHESEIKRVGCVESRFDRDETRGNHCGEQDVHAKVSSDNMPLIGQTPNLQPVDADAAARALAQAVQSHVQVDLWAEGDRVEFSCTGTLVGADESYLLVDVGPATGALLCSAVIHGGMEVDGSFYLFDTRCADEFAEVEPGVIRLLKPAPIAVADRRRSPRRRLREVTEVTLRPAEECDESQVRATLLNLSPDGLACRIATCDAGALAVGAVVRVAFRPGVSARAFHLNGRVISVIEGGTVANLVVGLEFIADERLTACRDRLRKALEMAD
jgi:hypothetical protein